MTDPTAGVDVTLDPDRVRTFPAGPSPTKNAVIDLVARTLAGEYPSTDQDRWAVRIRDREVIGSTGIGQHFAMLVDFQRPGEDAPTAAPVFDLWLFLVPAGVDWQAVDRLPVHVLACPVFRRSLGHEKTYLTVLAALASVWRSVTAAEHLALSRMPPRDAAAWVNATAVPRGKGAP